MIIKEKISRGGTRMRSDQFKSVSDRELAEQYLAMTGEDKSSVENEIINRFVAAKAKPRTSSNRSISRWVIRTAAFRIYRKYRGTVS